MRTALVLVVVPVAAAAALACTPRARIPDDERLRAERELEGQRRWLGVAAYAGPFFADDGKLLVSDQPLEELDLLETPGGEVIAPPAPERVLPPGTPLRVERIEFPTGWIIAGRYVRTPRYHPWVYLRLDGEPRPLVLVLSQLVDTAEGARREVERVLSASDPTPTYQAVPDAQRAAIARKEVVEGMSVRAVEMAWGYPETRVIDRPAETEAWTWPGGLRKAWFRAGRLVSHEQAPARQQPAR